MRLARSLTLPACCPCINSHVGAGLTCAELVVTRSPPFSSVLCLMSHLPAVLHFSPPPSSQPLVWPPARSVPPYSTSFCSNLTSNSLCLSSFVSPPFVFLFFGLFGRRPSRFLARLCNFGPSEWLLCSCMSWVLMEDRLALDMSPLGIKAALRLFRALSPVPSIVHVFFRFFCTF